MCQLNTETSLPVSHSVVVWIIKVVSSVMRLEDKVLENKQSESWNILEVKAIMYKFGVGKI